METKANYVLIGAFALAGFLGMLGFVLWFARLEINRQFSYYDIAFPAVSGLATASDVRFAGLPVGQVVEVRLATDNSGLIRVRIEVDAGTPVRSSSIATIESQGLTGVSYVALTAGDPADPLLRPTPGADVPQITAGRSVLQSLSEDAPQVVQEVLGVARQLRDILGEENQTRISNILRNLEGSSDNLGKTLEDFSTVTATVAKASKDIAAFSERLEAITNAATTALETANDTLLRLSSLAERADQTLTYADGALQSGQKTLDSAGNFIEADLPRALADLSETTASLRAQIDLVGNDAQAMMEEFRATGSLASRRFAEAEATIKATDAMLARMTEALGAFDSASRSFETFVETDGTQLVSDTRTMIANAEVVIASAKTVAQTDLPAIVADIRTASQTAARVVQEVGTDLSSATSRIDGLSASAETTLTTVTDTFRRANETLSRINTATETGDRALAAAERAFTSADQAMGEDIKAITDQIRTMLSQIDTAMAQVAADLPQITAELRQTAERANTAIGQFQGAVAAAAPPVQAFAREGLPQYTRLASETRALIGNLDSLVRRIERDPARYLLGGGTPEFRR